MSRYIDADSVKINYIGGFKDTIEVDYDSFMNAPSIDIVRCQDCKHWVYNFNGCARNPCTEPWYATDFCNYGERRVSDESRSA